MAETYLGLPVGQTVEVASWDALPEAVRVSIFGIANRLKGTPWTIAELESLKGKTPEEKFRLGYNNYTDAQIQEIINQVQNIKSYYVDPKTRQISVNRPSENGSATGTIVGSDLKPGQISKTPREYQDFFGSAGNVAFGLTPQGKIVRTNAPTTGNETLEELITLFSAGLTTGTGTMLTRGVSFTYDRFGNILSATDSTGKPTSIEQAKQIWDRFFTDNPDQFTRTQEIRAEQGLGPFVPGGLTGSSAKTVISKNTLSDGSVSVRYSDGTSTTMPASEAAKLSTSATSATSATSSGATNNPFQFGTEAYKAFEDKKSAFTLLQDQFKSYGLGALVPSLLSLIQEGVSPAEFTLRLRQDPLYQKRFSANQARIQKGLRALSEAEYVALEDQYQDVMRRYGLPQSYYTRTDLGNQPGFEKFIAGDVAPVELENRIQTAQRRVINSNPEISIALRSFYPNLGNGDLLAYVLDPDTALDEINRKITAAEIGGAAVQAGLTTNESDAQYLARYGITKEQAQQGYRTISGYLPTAQKLSDIYTKQVAGPYTQASAEREVFGVPGAAEAERQRKQLTSLEEAAFQGRSGLTGGALARDRAGSF